MTRNRAHWRLNDGRQNGGNAIAATSAWGKTVKALGWKATEDIEGSRGGGKEHTNE